MGAPLPFLRRRPRHEVEEEEAPTGPTLPAGIDQLTISASGSVKLFGGSISLVECLSGTGVRLRIYDNGYSNTGSAIYDITLSSGQTDLPSFFTINGMYAVITGTGSFRLTLNNY
jgi:hypothetical protein